MLFKRFKQRFRRPKSGGTRTELHAADDPLHGSPSPVEAHDPPPEPVASFAIDPTSYPLSLWDRAYDFLRKQDPDLVKEYEQLLLRELPVTAATPTASDNGLANTTGKISIAKVADFALWTKGFVATAVSASPEASLAWAGVCIILPILTNSRAAEQTNSDGFAYVTSRLRYYKEFEDHIVDLYQHILDFQLKSVLRFYRGWSGKLLRDVSKSDDWKEKLSRIKNLEDIVNDESQAINTLASRQALESVSGNTDEFLRMMQKFLFVAKEQASAIKDQTGQQENMHRDAEDKKCLADLCVTNPEFDKIRIGEAKGNILPDSCWILDHPDFHHWRQWREDPACPLLWIKGNPGKGKTMLISGIIDKLHATTQLADSGADELLSYFFCQAAIKEINNANSVLRGLIWLLVGQQPSLIRHVRKEYDRLRKDDRAGRDFFEGTNSWAALTVIFRNILSDASLVRTYLVVDALDDQNEPGIEQKLGKHPQINLELKENANQSRDQFRDILHQKANGTFLWVALVVQELAKSQAWEVLDVAKELPSDLYKLYDRMIDQIQGLQRNSEFRCLVLATAVATYRPIHLEEIGVLSGLPSKIHKSLEHVRQVVRLCGSVLTIQDNHVYFVHQSAKDYLVEKAEKADAMLFPSGIADIHRAIFTRSLERIS
ncbi:hypothetical protein B0T26DRAFT_875960, partial [Lasiosphaeria miniovina]